MTTATIALPNATLPATNFMLREHAAALRSHLSQCSQARGRWFRAAALGEQIHGLVAPRLISTVMGGAVLLGLIAAWA